MQSAVLARLRLGIGSHQWSQLVAPSSSPGGSATTTNTPTTTTVYQDIVETALCNGVTTLEVGQEGGDAVLASILKQALSSQDTLPSSSTTTPSITLLKRVGYRTVVSSTSDDTSQSPSQSSLSEPPERPLSWTKLLPGDVLVEDISQPSITTTKTTDSDSGTAPAPATTTATVVHNISSPSIQAALEESPLVYHPSVNTQHDKAKLQLQLLVHNPEVQGTVNGQSLTFEQRQARICDKLTESFIALQQQILQQQQEEELDHANDTNSPWFHLSSFGLCSHGLALPPDHDLHLSWTQAVVPALEQAHGQLLQTSSLSTTTNSNDHPLSSLAFSTVQLPLNVWEPTGLAVAQAIKQYHSSIQIYAMRPLTAYPTSTATKTTNSGVTPLHPPGAQGFPVVVSDWQLPSSDTTSRTTWTHELRAPPQAYQTALQAALQHFDAEDLLQQQQQSTEKLTPEQEETLQGCRLLLQLLHELDTALDTVTSWDAHEQALVHQVIPRIHHTFEAYDDETAAVLQTFFAAYSTAVRFSIARNARRHMQAVIDQHKTHTKQTRRISILPCQTM